MHSDDAQQKMLQLKEKADKEAALFEVRCVFVLFYFNFCYIM